MTDSEKKAKITQIQSLSDLVVLLEHVLTKGNLKSIQRFEEGYITAIDKTEFSNYKYIFFPSLQELKGKTSDVHSRIENIDYSTYNSIFVVSSHKKTISNYFAEKITEQFSGVNFTFWDSKKLFQKLDKVFPDYWSHDDAFIKPYEEKILKYIQEDFELKRLKLDEKYRKMLNMYIEPRLLIRDINEKEDSLFSHNPFQRKKMISEGNYFISGGAGTGKSTLLKQVAKEIIQNNIKAEKKTIPILIKQADILNAKRGIQEAMNIQLKTVFPQFDLFKVYTNYSILLLIDSIDGFTKKTQKEILLEIQKLIGDHDIRFIIGTRDQAYLLNEIELTIDYEKVIIQNFNLIQSKKFLEHFYQFDQSKSSKLLDSIIQNKILDKLPITPLTLSLISILFEEHQYEIPATITDIYQKFKTLLLGRAHAKSSLDFLDINVKERLLSLYALEVLQKNQREPRTVKEFEDFVTNFFASRSSTYDPSVLPDALTYFTKDIDILFIENNTYVKFKHDSFMEYFAATEIFRHRRDLEDDLVRQFNDVNWQNVSIFYSGHSKDMKDFLNKVTVRINDFKSLSDMFISNLGLGYLLQALYLTDEDTRANSIKTALDINIKIFDKIRDLSYERATFFEDLKEPTIATLCTIQFLFNYGSFTLKGALIKAYDEIKSIYNEYLETGNPRVRSIGFQLFTIAATLFSDKINDPSKIEDLFETKNILTDPLFVKLFDDLLDDINPELGKDLKEKANIKNRISNYNKAIQYYLKTPAHELRNTRFDSIGQYKRVGLFTEGITDVEIIQKAYAAISGNQDAYWKINQAGNGQTSGASTLSKMLSSMPPPNQNEVVIGIFDNDSKGVQEFNLI